MVTASVLVSTVVATFFELLEVGASREGGPFLLDLEESVRGRVLSAKAASSSRVGGGQAADGL